MSAGLDLLAELKWRGLLHQATDEEGLRAHLAAGAGLEGGRRGYVGFDPTADSLTIGNLVPIMLLRRLQLAGHTPVVLAGGGTGLIGDPSGKSAERQLMTEERVRANVEAQSRIFGQVLDFSEGVSNRALLVNNLDWLGRLGYLQVLREVGKHFSVNAMIQKDSVRERLHGREQGISYTEFSYMILQAYDFLHLYREMGVTVQMGGSDQWGNIVGGVDLIRRWRHAHGGAEGEEVFALTAPLVTKADGGKFGKTEAGAVWLTAERTSPYAFYQFWLNTADADLERFLKIFTFLPRERIEELMAAHAANPGAREAHRALAASVTEMMHGRTEREKAEAAARALFSGDVRSLPEAMLEEVLASAPSSTHDKSLLGGEGMPLVDLLAQTSIASSKGQARQLLKEGSISVNGVKVEAEARVTAADLLHGRIIALRRGKKSWHVTRWE